MTRSTDSLLGQVLAANVVLVVLTILAASLAAGLDLEVQGQRWEFLVLAMAMVLTLCVNMIVLKRRFRPLERLIERIERVDPAEPAAFEPGHEPFKEVDRLAQSFRGLLGRIEDERRRSGRLVLRAQEEERRRVARDLHDEVNQALTAILLRLEALAYDSPPEKAGEVAEDVAGEEQGQASAGEEQGQGADGAGAERSTERRASRRSRRSGSRRIHRIQSGDTLWEISGRQLGRDATNREIANRVVRVARINGLKNPDLIYAGDTLRLRA
jgi:HAMP domain-containing protein